MKERADARPADAHAWIALFALIALYLLALARSAPPELAEGRGDEHAFSVSAAREVLARIEGSGAPHPIGSRENQRVRDEIVATFTRAGLSAETDEHLVAGTNRVVGLTRNIVARIPGTRPGKSVLVCAHHDSVPAGPGSSDDGAGVAAALEIARVLAREGPFENDVVFLIDDGEEAGLLGAQAFLAHHPLARDVGVVVNVEARGTCGRAFMFETSEGNGALIAALARGVPHPSATSVAYEIYRRMPNDTDLTVFKRAGLAGLNFAFIGGVSRYHTPRDDLAHQDPRSLQHLGESGLGVVRELARMDLERIPAADAAYADVLGLGLVRLPASWLLPLALVALGASVWSLWRQRARSRLRACAAVLLAPLAAALAALGASSCLTWISGSACFWSAHPAWTRAAILLGALAVAAWTSDRVSGPQCAGGERLGAAHVLLAGLGALTAATVAGASHLFVLPALAAATLWIGARDRLRLRTWIPLGIAAVCTLPVVIGVEDGFGYAPAGAVVLGVAGGLFAVLAGPAWAARTPWPLGFAAATACTCALVAACVPAFDEHEPAWVNLVHEEDSTGGPTRWIAVPISTRMPEALARAAAFEERANAFEGSFWSGPRPGFVAPSSPTGDPPPRLEVLSETRAGEERIVRARLGSPRGAVRFAIRTPRGTRLRAISRGAERIEKGLPKDGLLRLVGLDASGVELEFAIPSQERIDVEIADSAPRLPPEYDALARARPTWCVPRGEGDVSVIVARARL